MSSSTSPSVVLGATGGAGRAVVQELLRRNEAVRAVSRSAPEAFSDAVETVSADGTVASTVTDACANASVIYNCINVPYAQWPETLPTLAENAIAAATQAEAPLVVLDNLYAYGPCDAPMTEETARQPSGPKGKLRAELEDIYLSAHESGRAKITIGRASDFYGPRANSATRELVFDAALDGKTAAWLGSLDAPHTMSYLPDVARGLVTLAAHDEAFGDVWHLPSNESVTGREFIEMVYAQVEAEPSMRAYGYWALTAAGLFDRQVWEVRELLYQFEDPFIMDTSKFEAAFEHEITPYDEAIRTTLDWHRSQRDG